MFDLEFSIKKWLRQFNKHKAFDDGSVHEMEVHLRDHIDDLKAQGHKEQKAFEMAVLEFGEIPHVAREEFSNIKSKTTFKSLLFTAMLNNYIKSSLRNLVRNPMSSFINVFGLAVGFGVFFILWQYAKSELETDSFHNDADRIVRLAHTYKWRSEAGTMDEVTVGTNVAAVTAQLGEDFSQVVDYTRIYSQNNFGGTVHGSEVVMSVTNPDGKRIATKETNLIYGDANFFQFFNFPLSSGSPKFVLKEPATVVLSEASAQKYFRERDPIGETIYVNDTLPFKVTGVFEDLPKNTHFNFDMVISISSAVPELLRDRYYRRAHCYLKMAENVSATELQTLFDEAREDYWEFGDTFNILPVVQPLSEVPFISYDGDFYLPRSKQALIILNIVPFIILLMAWINYVNLSISSSGKRFKEIAAKKTLGARPSDFIVQFMTESTVFNLISILSGLLIAVILRYNAENFLGFYMIEWDDISVSSLLMMLVFFMTGALFSGLYPALVTLKRSPSSLFDNKRSSTEVGNAFTNWLTTVQYTTAVILIIWIFSLYLQIDLILNRSMGVNEERVVVVEAPLNENVVRSRMTSFVKDLRLLEGVEASTLSNTVSGDEAWRRLNIREASILPRTSGGVDENFIPFYNIQLLAGRNFKEDSPEDNNKIIISTACLAPLDFERPEDAIGRRIHLRTYVTESGWSELEIIGVIQGYRQRTFYVPRGTSRVDDYDNPTMFLTYKDRVTPWMLPRRFSVRVSPENFEKSIEEIEALYHATFPNELFNWFYLKDRINLPYAAEKLLRNQIILFTGVAILIACLGFLGTISIKVVAKTKELGIRKILGAEFRDLGRILLSTTAIQLAIAISVGIPLAHYLINEYNQKFYSQIDLVWWHYTIPVILLVTIMAFTILSTVIKSWRTNPVDSIRYE